MVWLEIVTRTSMFWLFKCNVIPEWKHFFSEEPYFNKCR